MKDWQPPKHWTRITTIEVPDLGNVSYDIAYGGAFYAFVTAEDVGLRTMPEDTTKSEQPSPAGY